jgi:hypothetical protein
METEPGQMPEPGDENPEESKQGDPPPDEGSGDSTPLPADPETGV